MNRSLAIALLIGTLLLAGGSTARADGILTISVADTNATEDIGQATFLVTLSCVAQSPVTIAYTTVDGTAIAPGDYTERVSSITFPVGITQALLFIPVHQDGVYEPQAETFELRLTSASLGTILDDTGVCTLGSTSNLAADGAFTWGQNIAWTNWRPPGSDGTHAERAFLAGKIWNQNVGWIDLGSGPADGIAYTNTSNKDFGINVAADGTLSGFAWGQNIGWVQFEQTHGQPRIDLATGDFAGYAWSQNCAWINLGTGTEHGLRATVLGATDDDEDAMDDGWERDRVARAGLSTGIPAKDLQYLDPGADFDGDGETDDAEYIADTDPFDAGDSLQGTGLRNTPGGMVELEWRSSPNRIYRIHSGDNLTKWDIAHDSVLPSAGDTTTQTVPRPKGGRHFWNIEALLPLAP